MKNYLYINIVILFLLFPLAAEEQLSDKSIHLKPPEFLSWDDVKKYENKKIIENVEIDGFVSFRGSGDFPEVILWETSECLKFHRIFRNISVDPESFMHLVQAKYGTGEDTWSALNGCYVKLTGNFKDQEQGLDYANLGRLLNVSIVKISNNGNDLIVLDVPRKPR